MSYSQSMNTYELEKLPIEILLEVFKYLDAEDYNTLRLTNKNLKVTIEKANKLFEHKYKLYFPAKYRLKDEKVNINWYKAFQQEFKREFMGYPKRLTQLLTSLIDGNDHYVHNMRFAINAEKENEMSFHSLIRAFKSGNGTQPFYALPALSQQMRDILFNKIQTFLNSSKIKQQKEDEVFYNINFWKIVLRQDISVDEAKSIEPFSFPISHRIDNSTNQQRHCYFTYMSLALYTGNKELTKKLFEAAPNKPSQTRVPRLIQISNIHQLETLPFHITNDPGIYLMLLEKELKDSAEAERSDIIYTHLTWSLSSSSETFKTILDFAASNEFKLSEEQVEKIIHQALRSENASILYPMFLSNEIFKSLLEKKSLDLIITTLTRDSTLALKMIKDLQPEDLNSLIVPAVKADAVEIVAYINTKEPIQDNLELLEKAIQGEADNVAFYLYNQADEPVISDKARTEVIRYYMPKSMTFVLKKDPYLLLDPKQMSMTLEPPPYHLHKHQEFRETLIKGYQQFEIKNEHEKKQLLDVFKVISKKVLYDDVAITILSKLQQLRGRLKLTDDEKWRIFCHLGAYGKDDLAVNMVSNDANFVLYRSEHQQTPLMIAAHYMMQQTINTLLRGSNDQQKLMINLKDQNDQSALDYAISTPSSLRYSAVIKRLIAAEVPIYGTTLADKHTHKELYYLTKLRRYITNLEMRESEHAFEIEFFGKKVMQTGIAKTIKLQAAHALEKFLLGNHDDSIITTLKREDIQVALNQGRLSVIAKESGFFERWKHYQPPSQKPSLK